MEVTNMLNKELNGEMKVSTEELENETVDIECVLKCVDILQRYTNDFIHVKRLMRILGAKEFYSYCEVGNPIFKRMEFRNLYNGITELGITVELNKNYITNKEPSPGLKNEFKDIKYVANSISAIIRSSERGICIKGIEELPDNQAHFYTNRNCMHGFISFRIENLWYYGYNGIESLQVVIITDK